MSRQINMDIFKDTYSAEVPQDAPYGEAFPGFDANRVDVHYDELASRIERTRYEVEEWMKSLNLRFEKTVQRLQSLEERFKQASQDNHERLATVYSRVKERQSSDLKFEALIERHNQIVQSFELRLTQSQRLIENQALQLAKQQELIDDARRSLEKIKKL